MKKTFMFAVIGLLIAANCWAAAELTSEDVIRKQQTMADSKELYRALSAESVNTKYYVEYKGYEIKNIGPKMVDVILHVKIFENQIYNKRYNELLNNMAESESTIDTLTVWGNYRIEDKRLVANEYKTTGLRAYILDDIPIQIYANGKLAGKCSTYRDNLAVSFNITKFLTSFVWNFPKVFMQNWNEEEVVIDKKWEHAGIKEESRIIPSTGLLLKLKYKINGSDIDSLKSLNVTLSECLNKEHNHWRNINLK